MLAALSDCTEAQQCSRFDNIVTKLAQVYQA